MTLQNYILEYHQRIQSGEIIVGKWVRVFYEKVIADVEAGRVIFSAKKAGFAIAFIEKFCRHHEGELAPDRIKLELWQKAMISVLFGVLDHDGNRQFREAFVVVGRKNGKTVVASSVSNKCAFADGEYGGRVYMAAPKLEQAHLCFDGFWQMVQKEPTLDSLAQKRRSDIYIPSTNTTVKPLAFNAKKSDGFNISLCIADEIASWNGNAGLKFYEVLKSSFGARRQPLLLSITTAGYENDGVYDELMKRSTAYLLGNSGETRLAPFLYIIDDPEKWDDLDELKKANPNLGVSIRPEYLLDEIEIARGSLSKLAEFKTKYCNIKQSSTQAWLPFEAVDKISKDVFTLNDLRGCYCVAGIDLSQTTDLTAASIVVEKNYLLYVITQFFAPASKIPELQEREGVPYDIYARQGWLRPSGENYVDYKDVVRWIVSLVKDYGIRPLKIGYDRYSAQYMVQELQQLGFHTYDVRQGENLTPVLNEAEGLIRDGTLRIGKNNLLKTHFLNVAVKRNSESSRYMPVKIEQRLHIDGFMSVIDALTVRQQHYTEIGRLLKNAG